mgnify:CR=1 FL=1
MAQGGRVAVCGSIANYNDTEKQKCTYFLFDLYNYFCDFSSTD